MFAISGGMAPQIANISKNHDGRWDEKHPEASGGRGASASADAERGENHQGYCGEGHNAVAYDHR